MEDAAALAPRQHRGRIYPPIPPEIFSLLSHGKLEQVCPECGREEAAHWYCSQCLRQMQPTDWRTWAQLHPARAARLRDAALASGGAARFAAAREQRAARPRSLADRRRR